MQPFNQYILVFGRVYVTEMELMEVVILILIGTEEQCIRNMDMCQEKVLCLYVLYCFITF